jgi:hypothetical protein
MRKQYVDNPPSSHSRAPTPSIKPPRGTPNSPMASFFHPADKLTAEQRRDDMTLLRIVANTAMFWALCRQANGGCLRAKRCRADAHECVGRFTQVMPEDAWEWIEASMQGQREARPFDDVVAENPDAYEAFIAWRERLTNAIAK